jgi:hypothetical protein
VQLRQPSMFISLDQSLLHQVSGVSFMTRVISWAVQPLINVQTAGVTNSVRVGFREAPCVRPLIALVIISVSGSRGGVRSQLGR